MTTDRPIIAVRFHTAVTLGGREDTEWVEDRPGVSALNGKIKPRAGNPELGEQRTSLIFEIRNGAPDFHVDVEVPASNLAQVIRRPLAEVKPAGAKK